MADRPQDTAPPGTAKPKSKPSVLKTAYLVLYNFVSAILWSTVLGRTLLVATLHGYGRVFLGVGEFAKWTQTLALLEVAHAALGEWGVLFLSCFMRLVTREKRRKGGEQEYEEVGRSGRRWEMEEEGLGKGSSSCYKIHSNNQGKGRPAQDTFQRKMGD